MPKKRVHNFSAGPGVLPQPVLEEAARDLVTHELYGMSVMEMSHRSKGWVARQEKISDDLRRIMAIPEDYEILFLQGGASTQFAMVPLNLLPTQGASADYILTGAWSVKALEEARKLGRSARVAASSEAEGFDHIPTELDLDLAATYVHYTSNNTIYGTAFGAPPEVDGLPLVCDASSDILAGPFDFRHHDLVYAGAQKNMGPAGATIVIVHKDLLDRVPDDVPTMLAYKTHAAKKSAYNTPPVWSLYIMGLVLEWIERDIGGLDAMAERNRMKAALLYDLIDGSGGFYRGAARAGSRSLMNVTFRLPTKDDEARFLAEAEAADFLNLKGHRSAGGCRASIYNAQPIESIEALVGFMQDFQTRCG